MKNKSITAIKAKLPRSVRAIKWVRNHHFIELTDEDGNEAKLLAGGVLCGSCTKCEAKCLALQNAGQMVCTHCGGAVKWQWSKPQLAFLPEHESKFFGVDADKNK